MDKDLSFQHQNTEGSCMWRKPVSDLNQRTINSDLLYTQCIQQSVVSLRFYLSLFLFWTIHIGKMYWVIRKRLSGPYILSCSNENALCTQQSSNLLLCNTLRSGHVSVSVANLQVNPNHFVTAVVLASDWNRKLRHPFKGFPGRPPPKGGLLSFSAPLHCHDAGPAKDKPPSMTDFAPRRCQTFQK